MSQGMDDFIPRPGVGEVPAAVECTIEDDASPAALDQPLWCTPVGGEGTDLTIGPCRWSPRLRSVMLEGGPVGGIALGDIRVLSRGSLPSDCLLADGATYDEADYPELYALAAAEELAGNLLWTADDVARTFTVPDLRDRFLLGKGSQALGAEGGEETVKLTGAQSGLPAHAHYVSDAAYSDGTPGQARTSPSQPNAANSWLTNTAGPFDAAESHDNMPPYTAVTHAVQARPVEGGAIPGVEIVVPSRGDSALVVESDDNRYWIVEWWPNG